MNDTVEQCSFASCYNYQKESDTTFKETSNDRWKTKELVIAFTKLLEVKNKIEYVYIIVSKLLIKNIELIIY